MMRAWPSAADDPRKRKPSARRTRADLLLPLRIAAREMRGGLRGFYVLIACIGLGVMAIAGIASVSSGLADGLARQGRMILGGDLAFSLSLREASAAERQFLEQQALARRGAMSVV